MKSNLAISNFIPLFQYFTHTAILFRKNPHAFCTFGDFALPTSAPRGVAAPKILPRILKKCVSSDAL